MQYDSLPGDDPAEVAEQLAREEDRRRRQLREEERKRERLPEQDAVQAQYPQEHAEECCLNNALCNEFEHQAERLAKRAKARREAVQLKSVILDREAREQVNEEDMLGRRQPQDEFQGDVNMRTLRALLKMIDERGFERSPHQMKFHSAFERSTARVIYRDDWGTQRPAIMKKNGWAACSSEVLISTPRRFGKTFSIAIFAACLALSLKCEIVVFSPARRASRKLLERMVEFVRLLGHEPIEYNQEQCRVKSFDGKQSLIRSFPSKVGVCATVPQTRMHAHRTYTAHTSRTSHHTTHIRGSEPLHATNYASATASSNESKSSTLKMSTRPRTPLASSDKTWYDVSPQKYSLAPSTRQRSTN